MSVGLLNSRAGIRRQPSIHFRTHFAGPARADHSEDPRADPSRASALKPAARIGRHVAHALLEGAQAVHLATALVLTRAHDDESAAGAHADDPGRSQPGPAARI